MHRMRQKSYPFSFQAGLVCTFWTHLWWFGYSWSVSGSVGGLAWATSLSKLTPLDSLPNATSAHQRLPHQYITKCLFFFLSCISYTVKASASSLGFLCGVYCVFYVFLCSLFINSTCCEWWLFSFRFKAIYIYIFVFSSINQSLSEAIHHCHCYTAFLT